MYNKFEINYIYILLSYTKLWNLFIAIIYFLLILFIAIIYFLLVLFIAIIVLLQLFLLQLLLLFIAIISFCILNSISIFIFITKIWDIMYLSNLYIGSNIIKVFKHWEKKLKLSILYEILDF